MLHLKTIFPALFVVAIVALGNGQALAVTNDQIVSIKLPPAPEKQFYLRGGLNLQNGRIVEVPHIFEEFSYSPCGSIVIRVDKDVTSRKVGLIHGDSKGFEFKDESPTEGWLSVYRSKKLIGYAAKAVQKGNKVENLFCKSLHSSSSSTLSINGKKYTASIKNRRDLLITDGMGKEIYARRISGSTSLYELRSGGKGFGWLVGWHNSPESYPEIDFSVVRILAPFTDGEGIGRVKEHVIQGLAQSWYSKILEDEEDSFTFVEATALRGYIFQAYKAVTYFYYVPIFTDFRRRKGGIDVVNLQAPPKPFQENEQLSYIDLFLFNFKFDNWTAVRKLYKEKIRGQILKLNNECPTEMRQFLAAIKRPVKITKWTKKSYETMLENVWGEKNYLNLLDKLYDEGRSCAPHKDLYQKVIGVLNLPPDADLIEKILDAHVQ